MTEIDWLESEDPAEMLTFIQPKTSRRKLYLFACACLRRYRDDLTHPAARRALETGELLAEHRCDETARLTAYETMRKLYGELNDVQQKAERELRRARAAIERGRTQAEKWQRRADKLAEQAARERTTFRLIGALVDLLVQPMYFNPLRLQQTTYWAAISESDERRAQCRLLREIFGNPFRSPAPQVFAELRRDERLRALAQGIHDDRRWEDLPILGDALEEAGCTSDAILRHCRDEEEHVLGCWVLDGLLDFS